jgi:hypothetical protein
MFRPSCLHRALAVTAALLSAQAAAADPMVTDAKAYDTGGTFLGNAAAAEGPFAGNDKPTDLLDKLNNGLFPAVSSGWTLVGSSDEGGGPFTGNPGGSTGTLTLDALLDGPFVIALKAGNQYAAYFFDASFLDVKSIDYFTGNFASNVNGQPQDLSHASLYVSSVSTGTNTSTATATATATATSSTSVVDATATSGATTGGGVVPEPATLALWGLVGGGLALCRRRKAAAEVAN